MTSPYVAERLDQFRPGYLAARALRAQEGRRAPRVLTQAALAELRQLARNRPSWRYSERLKCVAARMGVTQQTVQRRLALIRAELPPHIGGIDLHALLCAAVDEARRAPKGRVRRGAGWEVAAEARRMREGGAMFKDIGARFGYSAKWAEGVCKGRRWA